MESTWKTSRGNGSSDVAVAQSGNRWQQLATEFILYLKNPTCPGSSPLQIHRIHGPRRWTMHAFGLQVSKTATMQLQPSLKRSTPLWDLSTTMLLELRITPAEDWHSSN